MPMWVFMSCVASGIANDDEHSPQHRLSMRRTPAQLTHGYSVLHHAPGNLCTRLKRQISLTSTTNDIDLPSCRVSPSVHDDCGSKKHVEQHTVCRIAQTSLRRTLQLSHLANHNTVISHTSCGLLQHKRNGALAVDLCKCLGSR